MFSLLSCLKLEDANFLFFFLLFPNGIASKILDIVATTTCIVYEEATTRIIEAGKVGAREREREREGGREREEREREREREREEKGKDMGPRGIIARNPENVWICPYKDHFGSSRRHSCFASFVLQRDGFDATDDSFVLAVEYKQKFSFIIINYLWLNQPDI